MRQALSRVSEIAEEIKEGTQIGQAIYAYRNEFITLDYAIEAYDDFLAADGRAAPSVKFEQRFRLETLREAGQGN